MGCKRTTGRRKVEPCIGCGKLFSHLQMHLTHSPVCLNVSTQCVKKERDMVVPGLPEFINCCNNSAVVEWISYPVHWSYSNSYSAWRHDTVRYGTVQYSIVWYSVVMTITWRHETWMTSTWLNENLDMYITVMNAALVFSVTEINGRRTKLKENIPELRSLVGNIGRSM